jgi:hypothetical protein
VGNTWSATCSGSHDHHLLHSLGLQVKDLDARSGGGAQPVPVGGEDQSVDNVTSLQRVQVFALVQVPEHGDSVLSTGSGQRTVGRDREGVDVSGVSVVVGLELALGQLPDLHKGEEDDKGGGVSFSDSCDWCVPNRSPSAKVAMGRGKGDILS